MYGSVKKGICPAVGYFKSVVDSRYEYYNISQENTFFILFLTLCFLWFDFINNNMFMLVFFCAVILTDFKFLCHYVDLF